MKHYRLVAWPELRPAQNRTAFRRLLSFMSHRHVSVAQMVDESGLRRQEVRDFVDSLVGQGVLEVRETEAVDSFFGSLRPLGGWLRRTFAEDTPANR